MKMKWTNSNKAIDRHAYRLWIMSQSCEGRNYQKMMKPKAVQYAVSNLRQIKSNKSTDMVQPKMTFAFPAAHWFPEYSNPEVKLGQDDPSSIEKPRSCFQCPAKRASSSDTNWWVYQRNRKKFVHFPNWTIRKNDIIGVQWKHSYLQWETTGNANESWKTWQVSLTINPQTKCFRRLVHCIC